jgi:ribosomal protein S18 acetylase RimI-like enzyme
VKNALARTVELREYSAGHFQRLWELDQRCFTSEIAYSRRELAHYLRSKKAVCLIAWDGDQLLGFVVGHSDPRGFGHVVTLDVDPDARHLGIGSTLMLALEERFKNAGCKSIFLEVAVNNLVALRFYKKHDYSVLKTLPRYYPGDLDGLLMGKRIEKPAQAS